MKMAAKSYGRIIQIALKNNKKRYAKLYAVIIYFSNGN